MNDLLRALENHLGRNHDIHEKLSFLDSFQEICDLDTYVTKKPTDEDLKKIMASGSDLHNYLSLFLYQN